MPHIEIPETLIPRLIDAGKAPDLYRISALLTPQEQRDFGYIMRFRPEPWIWIAENLSIEEVIALIKCLTIVESIYDNWRAGSVSPVIWLFRYLSSREPELSKDVANWVLANTHNPYIPFGSHNYGARSMIELSLLEELSLERKRERLEAELERKKSARERKAKEATRNLFGAIRRNDIQAVKGLLAKGADINAKDSEGVGILEHARMKGNVKILELLDSKHYCE